MDSESIYTTIPYTYLIGWSNLDLYYYGRRTATGCDPSDLFQSYFTSSDEVESYVSEYGSPDVIEIRRTFTSVEDCCRWECTVLRRLDAKNNDQFLNKTNGDSEWIYSGIDAVWMNRRRKNRRVRRERIENYRDMGWVEGRAVDWVWIKKDGGGSKRVAANDVDDYLQNGWELGRVVDVFGERNGMYGKIFSDDHRKAISKANTGLKRSKEFCEKTSKRVRGKNNPQYGKTGKSNTSFKGYWYTPHGVFESIEDCINNLPNDVHTNKVTLSKWCRNNDLTVSLISYRKSKYLQHYFTEKEAIGKTYKCLGFYRQ